MGEIINIFCTKCNYNKQILDGYGINFNNKDIIDTTLNGKALEEWKRVYNDLTKFSYSNSIGYCPKCNTYETCTYVEGVKNGKVITIANSCSQCGTELKLFTPQDTLYCPCCGDKLNTQTVGFWD